MQHEGARPETTPHDSAAPTLETWRAWGARSEQPRVRHALEGLRAVWVRVVPEADPPSGLDELLARWPGVEGWVTTPSAAYALRGDGAAVRVGPAPRAGDDADTLLDGEVALPSAEGARVGLRLRWLGERLAAWRVVERAAPTELDGWVPALAETWQGASTERDEEGRRHLLEHRVYWIRQHPAGEGDTVSLPRWQPWTSQFVAWRSRGV